MITGNTTRMLRCTILSVYPVAAIPKSAHLNLQTDRNHHALSVV
jgi:hypothetical protein